jgi:hypothetical protein
MRGLIRPSAKKITYRGRARGRGPRRRRPDPGAETALGERLPAFLTIDAYARHLVRTITA